MFIHGTYVNIDMCNKYKFDGGIHVLQEEQNLRDKSVLKDNCFTLQNNLLVVESDKSLSAAIE